MVCAQPPSRQRRGGDEWCSVSLGVRRPLRCCAKGARLRLLRTHRGRALVAVGHDPRHCGRRGRPPEARLGYFRETASSTYATLRRTRGTARISPRWLAHGWRPSAGSGGVRDHGETRSFAPGLPSQIVGLKLRRAYFRRRLRVHLGPDHALYELLDGEPLELVHHGERLMVSTDSPRPAARPRSPSGRCHKRSPDGRRCSPRHRLKNPPARRVATAPGC
jgi:Glycosyl hydrolase family 65, C-terminal domain